ncbi:MAG: PQQ-dependent sugar dehydrogenase [Gemmatimonadota bacterium]
MPAELRVRVARIGRTGRGLLAIAAAVLVVAPALTAQEAALACDPDDGAITLPEGFCALVVADGLGRIRHFAIQPDGDIYLAIRGRSGQTGGVLALRDTTGDGRADVQLRITEDSGGTGLLLAGDTLLYGRDDAILRFRLDPVGLGAIGAPDTLVAGLPSGGGHAAKSLAFAPGGDLFVNIGSGSNACQEENRARESPGRDPCPELRVRAGIWRFSRVRSCQKPDDGRRWASGLRNTVALAIRPDDGGLYGVVHGRDQLHDLWPDRYSERQSAEKPSEQFVHIVQGGRYSWPECYHDPEAHRLVLAPEYGGDGEISGPCATRNQPIAAYPAHWAPNALLFYDGRMFPSRYRGGAFIAFHGSWNRSPLPQGGYNVVFQPFDEEGPHGDWEIFADGFAGDDRSPRGARHRPSGLAIGPDGSLFVADDAGGRVWRILYRP